MTDHYFNYTAHFAESGWERRQFVVNWWKIYRQDPRWVPPHYPTLRRAFDLARTLHLARMEPTFLHLEALPGRSGQGRPTGGLTPALFEEPVAAAVGLVNPHGKSPRGILALLQCANDKESLERLLARFGEAMAPLGIRTLIGPTGLSPHLQSGVLRDHFHLFPPVHTPYNPPYLPEIMDQVCQPVAHGRLYHLELTRPPFRSPLDERLRLVDLVPERLTGDLLPLLEAAYEPWGEFSSPGQVEAAFMLRWLAQWPLLGKLALVDDLPVGFMLMQPDLAPQIHRAEGGRSWLRRLWLAWRCRQAVDRGRIVCGSVLPSWRRQGIGSALWSEAGQLAWNQGWRSLSIGPLFDGAVGVPTLIRWGAQPRQSYTLYHYDC